MSPDLQIAPQAPSTEEEEDNKGLEFLNALPLRHYLKTPGILKAHSTAF